MPKQRTVKSDIQSLVSPRLHWPTLLIGWLFVIYEYALRVSDSVILPTLQYNFHLSSFDISLLSSGYYFAYIAMMIPAGIIIDKLGLRISWLFGIGLLCLGSMLFASQENLLTLVVARSFMGIGSAFAIIGVFAYVVQFRHGGLLIGLTMAFCMVGVMLGQGPWLQLTHWLGNWAKTYWYAGLGAMVLWFVCCFSVQFRPYLSADLRAANIWLSLKALLSSPVFWVLALFIGCLSTPQTVFMALWGPHYLSVRYHLSSTDAAYLNSLMAVGGVVGSIVLGSLSDYVKRIKWVLVPVAVLTIISFIMVLQAWCSSVPFVIFLLVFIGFLTNGNTAVFAFLGRYFNQLPRASVQGTTNVFNMGGGPIFQLLIGELMVWHATSIHSQLSAAVMQKALWCIPVGLFCATVLLMLVSVKPKY